MAEYSISYEDGERVNALTTSTALLEITYVRRRKRRLESSNEGSVLSEEDIPAGLAAKRQ